jgi:hypothetical protein
MGITLANAFPHKRFFLEMFTRDIALEDCLLDLIDNSIDSLVRQKNIDPAKDILKKRKTKPPGPLHKVILDLSSKEISISDDCGGIPRSLIDEVFSFGHDAHAKLGQLGAYGIGLKRAIFKIAEQFELDTRTNGEGFRTSVNIPAWAQRDEKPEDWKIPVNLTVPSTNKPAGTDIKFTTLRDEVKMRIRDGAFEGRVSASIAQTYCLFLEDSIRVALNGKTVEPLELPLGSSGLIKPGKVEFTKGSVKVLIMASLAARRPDWAYDRAGWYVLCNGRVVVAADKTDLTGWGEALPNFHSKYNGFVGVVIFRSRNPLELPWTTTKRGLNRESPVFQSARIEMNLLARPIISFLNDMYKSELVEEPAERKIAEKVTLKDIREVVARKPATFQITKKPQQAKATTRIQYEAAVHDIERIKKAIRQPAWGANKVGKYTFDYFVKTECPD